MDPAYVRESGSQKQPYKVQYLHFRYLKFLVKSAFLHGVFVSNVQPPKFPRKTARQTLDPDIPRLGINIRRISGPFLIDPSQKVVGGFIHRVSMGFICSPKMAKMAAKFCQLGVQKSGWSKKHEVRHHLDHVIKHLGKSKHRWAQGVDNAKGTWLLEMLVEGGNGIGGWWKMKCFDGSFFF